MFAPGRFVNFGYFIALSFLVVVVITLANAAPTSTVSSSKAEVTKGQAETLSGEHLVKQKAFDRIEKTTRAKGKVVKRSAEEDEDAGDAFGEDAQALDEPLTPEGSASASGSAEGETEGIEDGIAPVKGPYIKLSPDGTISDEEDNGKTEGYPKDKIKVTKPSYKNWDEYLQNQRSAIKEAIAGTGSLSVDGSILRPVIHSDDHFRFMDKLFKAKNDRVKAFHALVLYMKEQGKEFKIPQNPNAVLKEKEKANQTASVTVKPSTGSNPSQKPGNVKTVTSKPAVPVAAGRPGSQQKPATDQKAGAGSKPAAPAKPTDQKSAAGKPATGKANDPQKPGAASKPNDQKPAAAGGGAKPANQKPNNPKNNKKS